LHDKNNALIRSPLPLKESIMQDTGLTETDRVSFLDKTYNELFSIKPYPWEPELIQE